MVKGGFLFFVEFKAVLAFWWITFLTLGFYGSSINLERKNIDAIR
jgi:hypothetical protein